MSKKVLSDNEVKEIIFKYVEEGKSILQISKEVPYSYDVVRRVLVENGIKIRSNSYNSRKYHCNEHYFDEIDSPEKAYWLGFIYADGYISFPDYSFLLGIGLAKQDEEHLIKFKNAINSNHKINTYKSHGYANTMYSRITIRSDHMCKQLMQKGVVLHKTNILKFPYNIVPDDLMSHFIRGYFDGDGCLTYHIKKGTNRTVFSIKIVGTKEVLEGINKYIPINKTFNLTKRRKNNTNNYNLEIGGNKQVGVVLDYMYKNSTVHLDRKYEKYLYYKSIYK